VNKQTLCFCCACTAFYSRELNKNKQKSHPATACLHQAKAKAMINFVDSNISRRLSVRMSSVVGLNSLI